MVAGVVRAAALNSVEDVAVLWILPCMGPRVCDPYHMGEKRRLQMSYGESPCSDRNGATWIGLE